MRHGIVGYKLGRNTGSRKALFKSLARSVVLEEAIHTTLPKAKAVRSFVEKLITLGKDGGLSARRRILRYFPEDQAVQHKLVGALGVRFSKRSGGYTRILKMGYRHGDNAPVARLELTEAEVVFKEKRAPVLQKSVQKSDESREPQATLEKAVIGKVREDNSTSVSDEKNS